MKRSRFSEEQIAYALVNVSGGNTVVAANFRTGATRASPGERDEK